MIFGRIKKGDVPDMPVSYDEQGKKRQRAAETFRVVSTAGSTPE